jgi:hypothetical protein
MASGGIANRPRRSVQAKAVRPQRRTWRINLTRASPADRHVLDAHRVGHPAHAERPDGRHTVAPQQHRRQEKNHPVDGARAQRLGRHRAAPFDQQRGDAARAEEPRHRVEGHTSAPRRGEQHLDTATAECRHPPRRNVARRHQPRGRPAGCQEPRPRRQRELPPREHDAHRVAPAG